MAGVGATFNSPRVAGAEDDGFRARSTSAAPRSRTLQQSVCGANGFGPLPVDGVVRRNSNFLWAGSTSSGGIVVR
jgi:hypothetical protein